MWCRSAPQFSSVYSKSILCPGQALLFVCFIAIAAAAPQSIIDGGFVDEVYEPAVILRDDRQDNGDGNFNFAFETSNGITEERTGTRGVEGQSNMQGSYRWAQSLISDIPLT